MPVRAVLFDFYGTLARAVEWGPTHAEVFTAHGLDLDLAAWDVWDSGADGLDHAEHSASRDAYTAWELERFRRRAAACGVGPDDLEALVADLHAASKTFTMAAYPEVPGVLARLREDGIRVAVCSNWDWDLDRALAACGLDGLIDVAVTSAQAGARKPHPRIYRHTLERCGLGAADALFVGDSWGPDVEGPLAAGMRPVHIRRPDDERQPPLSADGVATVTDLRGVLDLL